MYISGSDCMGVVSLPIKEPRSIEAGNSTKQSTTSIQLLIKDTESRSSGIVQNGYVCHILCLCLSASLY